MDNIDVLLRGIQNLNLKIEKDLNFFLESKKRGLSLEEKRKVLLEIFHDTLDVFQLKDLEKLAPKKGVVQQSVKEVLQTLVDDDLVHQEKIGSSNFLWSFPSEAAVKLKNDLEKLEKQVQENSQMRVALQKELEESQKGKQDSAARTSKMEEKRNFEATLRQQQSLLAQFADNDPERYQHMQEASTVATSAANRWLDNTDMLKKWMRKRFEGQEQQLDSFFAENGFTEELEYLA